MKCLNSCAAAPPRFSRSNSIQFLCSLSEARDESQSLRRPAAVGCFFDGQWEVAFLISDLVVGDVDHKVTKTPRTAGSHTENPCRAGARTLPAREQPIGNRVGGGAFLPS